MMILVNCKMAALKRVLLTLFFGIIETHPFSNSEDPDEMSEVVSYTDALPIKKISKMLNFPVTDLSRLSRWCLKCETKVDFRYKPRKPSEKAIERKIETNKNENQIKMINRNKSLNKKSTFDEPTLPESTPKKLQQNMLKMIDRNKKSND